jgi:hypothetical protein
MAEDFEKNRVEYVQHLENQVKHLQHTVAELQAQAKWIPAVAMVMDPREQVARITLAFGGKHVTATVPQHTLVETSVTDTTSAVIDSFFVNLIADRFREVVQPEVERATTGVRSIQGAGKW